MLELTTVARGSALRDSWWVEEFHGEPGLLATSGNLIVVTEGLPADCQTAVTAIRQALYAGSAGQGPVTHAVSEAARILAQEPGAQVSAVAVLLRPSGGVEAAGVGSCTAYHFVRAMGRLERLTPRTAARGRLGDRDPEVGSGGAQLESGDLVIVVSGNVLGSVTDQELEVIAGEGAELGPETAVELILERVSRRDPGARCLAVAVSVQGERDATATPGGAPAIPVAAPPAPPGARPPGPAFVPGAGGLPLGGRRPLPSPPSPAPAPAEPVPGPRRGWDETDDTSAGSSGWGGAAGPGAAGTGAAAAAAAFMAGASAEPGPAGPPPTPPVAPPEPARPVPPVPERGIVEPMAAGGLLPGVPARQDQLPSIPLPKVTRGEAPAPPPLGAAAAPRPGRRPRRPGPMAALGGLVSGVMRFVLLSLLGLVLAAVVVGLGFLAVNLWDGALTFGPASPGQVRSLEEGDLFTRPFVRTPGQVAAQAVRDGTGWQQEVDELWALGDAGDLVALRRIVELLEWADATQPGDPALGEKLRVARINLLFRQRMAEVASLWPDTTTAETVAAWSRAVETLESLMGVDLPGPYRRQLAEKLYAAHVNQARALDAAGRRFEATGHLQRARQIDPARPEANDLLASRS